MPILNQFFNLLSVGLMNYFTMEVYKKFNSNKVPSPPKDGNWKEFLKDAAISSSIPLIASKPEILLKPINRFIGFSKDLVTSDQNKPKYITTIPNDRLLTIQEYNAIFSTLLRNPNFLLFIGTVGVVLIIKSYVDMKLKEKDLDLLIKNHQSPVSLDERNRLAMEKYIKKHGGF